MISYQSEAKEQIRNENLFILFDYSSEGDIREQVFEKIHEGIEKNNISPNKVIFICSASQILMRYMKVGYHKRRKTRKNKNSSNLSMDQYIIKNQENYLKNYRR